jgi:hypothetical protein
MEQARRADLANEAQLAVAKRDEAKTLLESYLVTVAKCQTPRFTREAERMSEQIAVQ